MCLGCGILNLTAIFVSFSAGFLAASVLALGLYSFMEKEESSKLKNITEVPLHSFDVEFPKEETNYIVNLSKEVKVLCLVLIKSDNENMAKRIKFTWGKRCNELIFFGNQEDPSLPAISMDFDEPLDSWSVTRMCFDYVYKNTNHTNFDWILKADDETYVVVENLRYMLQNYDASQPIYVDDITELESKERVKSVKLGYIISKTALKKIVEDETKCQPFGNEMEYYYLNRCLDKIGLEEVNSKDCLGRLRFFRLGLGDILFDYERTGLYKSDFKKNPSFYTSCSDYAVLFHLVTDYEMFGLEYLIYHLTPYGIIPNVNGDLNDCRPAKLIELMKNKKNCLK